MRLNHLIFFTLSILAPRVFAAADTWSYTCKSAGKFKEEGAFYEGYSVLTLHAKTIQVEFFHENGLAHGTTKDATYVYNLGEGVDGSGKLAGYIQADLNEEKSQYSGDGIPRIYLEPVLLEGGKELRNGKLGGLFTFQGHGFVYDWNMCFRGTTN